MCAIPHLIVMLFGAERRFVVSSKKIPIDLSVVRQNIAAAGALLVVRGVRLQGIGRDVPAGVEYKGRPDLQGFRVVRDQATDQMRAVIATGQLRRPGVLSDGGQRSLMYPKFSFGADLADAAIAAAKGWEVVDIVANFSTTWDSTPKYVPASEFEANPAAYQRAIGTDGQVMPNITCVPVKQTTHSYAAQVLDFAKSDAAASDLSGAAAPAAAPTADQPF